MYSRRESEYISGGMLRVEVAGRRPGGRAERRFMDGVKDDKELVVVREGGRGGEGAMEAGRQPRGKGGLGKVLLDQAN